MRSRCKACTFPQRPSRVAFAIRICSRRTGCATVCQSRASHVRPDEDAPSGGSAPVVICFSSCCRFSRLSCDERPVGRGRTFVPSDDTRIPTVTVGHSLFPTSQTRTALGAPSDTLSQSRLGTVRGFHVPFEKYAGGGADYRPGSVWTTRTQTIDVLPASTPFWASVTTTYACVHSRSLSSIQISSPYQLSRTHPVCGYQEGAPLAIGTPHNSVMLCSIVRAALDSCP